MVIIFHDLGRHFLRHLRTSSLCLPSLHLFVKERGSPVLFIEGGIRTEVGITYSYLRPFNRNGHHISWLRPSLLLSSPNVIFVPSQFAPVREREGQASTIYRRRNPHQSRHNIFLLLDLLMGMVIISHDLGRHFFCHLRTSSLCLPSLHLFAKERGRPVLFIGGGIRTKVGIRYSYLRPFNRNGHHISWLRPSLLLSSPNVIFVPS
jgi:hypothetical protein